MAQAAYDLEHPAVAFITALFGATTELPVFFQTLANDKGDLAEARIATPLLTRDIERLVRFIMKHGRARRGMFFCVATLAPGSRTRNKDTVRESIGLHTDIDFKNVAEPEAEIRARLATLRCPPTVIVRSGGGLHLYWLFREKLDAQAHRLRIEDALHLLANLVGGDPAVCDICRLMRLPGTTNSKYGDQRPVVCEQLDGPRYELSDLEEWLAETQPILRFIPPPPKAVAIGGAPAKPTEPLDPWEEVAREIGRKSPLDVDAMLEAMAIGNIHNSQVRISAALIYRGQPIEEVVELLLDASRKAAGAAGAKWNWRTEESKIRGMCQTALKKWPPPVAPAAPAAPVAGASEESTDAPAGVSENTSDARDDPPADDDPPPSDENVVDLDDARTRKKQAKAKPKPQPRANAQHIQLALAVLKVLRERDLDLMFSDAGDCRYGGGLWRLETDKTMKAWLDRSLEEGSQGLKMESTDRLIREARNYILRLPELHRENVPFDQHGCVPTLGELVNPRTGEVKPMTRDDYCTWRVPFAYDPAATCSHWLQMLDDVFADRTPEVRALHVQIIQELLGAGLIDRKSKALSRALVLVGGSDYGKSGLIDVMAGLFGDRKNATDRMTVFSF
ncbi:DNA-primase RepB domain-containing protein [Bradyrhizobium neotropicale]|uniref:DNA-primase RepB domain-containing protein n=1 Tax=Bradyrhizobium neotropicale TaxID=1497615 RepID=UPI001AD6976D|nr:DNA-primase RepB domain-containing protein [Bradyrhizobium neotropicale]MBO4228149.1 hypothetical protein [Bradyrhizobium neotropicale]